MSDGSMKPYIRLANAIVILATDDYRISIRALQRNENNGEALHRKEECEHFFRSGWFEALCDLDPERLIVRLQQHCNTRRRKTKTEEK